jgi:hypothetical protein
MLRKILAASIIAALPATAAMAQFVNPAIDVVKTASCGCCGGWITAMEDAGFTVRPRDVSSEELYSLKVERGIPDDLMACHTATVAGYTVEGHVPVSDVRRLLEERPNAIGIATPGMPVGSPGMDYGDEKEPFNVVLIRNDGSTEIYASYSGN